MKTDGITDNARGVEHSLEVLNDDENNCYPKWVPPISELKSGDEHGRHPAKHDADVRNHGQDDHEQPDKRREVQADENGQRAADKSSINQTDEQLTAKVGNDVTVDLRQDLSHFVLQG